MTFAYEAYVVNKTVLMLNFLSVIMTLWVGRRMSLFLGATSYIFKSNKTHDDCNLNGSEKKSIFLSISICVCMSVLRERENKYDKMLIFVEIK